MNDETKMMLTYLRNNLESLVTTWHGYIENNKPGFDKKALKNWADAIEEVAIYKIDWLLKHEGNKK